MDTRAFFTFRLWWVVGWVYKDLFERRQGVFKSDAVNPLNRAVLTLPVCLTGVPLVSLTLSLFPTCHATPLPSTPSLTCWLLSPTMDAVHLVDGRSTGFVRWADLGSSPAALFLAGDPEQVPLAQSLGLLCEVVTSTSHPSKPPVERAPPWFRCPFLSHDLRRPSPSQGAPPPPAPQPWTRVERLNVGVSVGVSWETTNGIRVYRGGQKVRNPWEGQQLEVRCVDIAVWRRNSLPIAGPQSCCLKPSTDWVRPTHRLGI